MIYILEIKQQQKSNSSHLFSISQIQQIKITNDTRHIQHTTRNRQSIIISFE